MRVRTAASQPPSADAAAMMMLANSGGGAALMAAAASNRNGVRAAASPATLGRRCSHDDAPGLQTGCPLFLAAGYATVMGAMRAVWQPLLSRRCV
jgi:hypothetical protein